MRKFIAPIIVIVVGFAISYWAYTGLRATETERALAEFDRRAANISSVLTNGIKGYSTAMETLKNITSVSLRYSGQLKLDQLEDYQKLKEEWDETKAFFNQMAKDAGSSFPGFFALGWVVPTRYSELEQLELAGKFLISPKYEIRQFGDDGLTNEIVEFDEHFPVWYVEPMEQNEIGLGMDFASADITRNAVIEARDTGNTISTRPINWIKTLTGQLGFLVFDAVYLNDKPMATIEERKANIHSISYGAILVDDMMNSSLRGLREEGLEFFVFPHADEIEIGTSQAAPVYSSNMHPESFQKYRTAAVISGFEQTSVFDVLGRNWTLYSYPEPGFLSGYQSTGPVVAFIAGIFITLALALYLFQTAGRTQRIEALVEKRTRELSQTNEHLEREMVSRIQADKQRRELEIQLLQTQKMESVGQLAGGVAHDFNNLLQAILGYSEMAMDNMQSDTPVYGHVQQVMEAGERARVLVRQLLAFSRQQVLNLSDVNLDKVMEDLIQMIRRVIGEHITLDVVSNGDLGIIRADPGQIEQILINLCVNARDAMGDGGTLTIETGNTQLDDAFCETRSWASPGHYVLLSVTDTGCGIDEDIMHRIFEPFFTTKELGKGTGLGLSTVFGIVRQHNGTVDVHSEVGKGTTFRIYFPVIEATETAPIEAKTDFSQGGTETILLADDEKLVRDVADAMLSKAGYTVLTAVDGEEAIQLFDKHVEVIDIALLDVVMPKVGGKAVADHILKRRPKFPVLFCSGYSSDSIHTNFVLDDHMVLLQKPYRRSELLRKVREVIENAHR